MGTGVSRPLRRGDIREVGADAQSSHCTERRGSGVEVGAADNEDYAV